MIFLKTYQDWIKGELQQARSMLVLGALLLVGLLLILKSDGQILSGLAIPLGLTISVLIGYGSFIFLDRKKRLVEIERAVSEKKSGFLAKEARKLKEGIATCKLTIRIWIALICVGLALFFFFVQPYFKGVALGLVLLGLTLLFIDFFIDRRAKRVYPVLKKLTWRVSYCEVDTIISCGVKPSLWGVGCSLVYPVLNCF